MRRFIIRRAIQSVGLLLAISFIGFMIVHLAPGGPEVKFMMDPRMTPKDIQNIREHYGLTDPLPVQYGKWILNAVRGDLGVSYDSLYPVTNEITRALPNTLLLITAGMLLGLLGIPIGIFIALRRGSFSDNLVRVLTVAGSAIPHWWLGLLVLLATSNLAIATGIKILPLPGYNGAEASNPFYQVWQLVLPSILIALAGWLTYSRITRTQVLDILSQDYVRTAHSKGLSQGDINRHHILKNALIPIITTFGAQLPLLIGSSIIFEQIFSLPGIGKLTIVSLTSSDFPVAIGVLMFVSTISVAALFICDILYALVDPRVRY